MRLYKGDLIKLEHEGEERIMRVASIWQKQVVLADHNETGNLPARDRNPDDPFSFIRPVITSLKLRNARKVLVDVLGRVHDPGPPQ